MYRSHLWWRTTKRFCLPFVVRECVDFRGSSPCHRRREQSESRLTLLTRILRCPSDVFCLDNFCPCPLTSSTIDGGTRPTWGGVDLSLTPLTAPHITWVVPGKEGSTETLHGRTDAVGTKVLLRPTTHTPTVFVTRESRPGASDKGRGLSRTDYGCNCLLRSRRTRVVTSLVCKEKSFSMSY